MLVYYKEGNSWSLLRICVLYTEAKGMWTLIVLSQLSIITILKAVISYRHEQGYICYTTFYFSCAIGICTYEYMCIIRK